MLEYSVEARRIDDRGSLATAKQAEVVLDTGMKTTAASTCCT